MDSGNSASIQSSSTGGGGGGDGQEFESCSGETMSALFNSASMASFENMSASQLYCHNNGSSFSAHHQQHQVSNYTFDPPAFSQNSPGCNFMINQNCDSNNSNTFDSSKSNGADSNNNLGMAWLNKYGATTPSTTVTYSSPHRPRLSPLSIPSSLAVPSSANNSPQSTDHQGGGGGGGGRNPKKRSRAARGSPTMVLTTDTNNFRQMVQEFTGIPPPPFGAAPTAFLGRARFDLFGGVSSVGMQHPLYSRKPFPQKIAPQNFMATINDPTAAIKSHLQMPSSSTAPKNFLQGDRDPATSQQPKATESLMNKFGLGHDISNTIAKADSTTSTSVGHGNMMTSNLDNERIPYQHQTIVDKGPPSKYNGGVTMGEAMVDSWICSSD